MRRDLPVRRPLLQGRQPIAGLWFDATRLPEAVRCRRLLHLWRPGAQAFRFHQGDVLRFAAHDVRSIDCAQAGGEALRALGDSVLGSAPLTPEERRDIGDADLVLVRDAHLVCLRFQDAVPLDPSAWIDLDDTPLHDLYDCSDPPALIDVDAVGGKPVRGVFGDHVPPASEERDALLRAFLRNDRGRAHPAGQSDGGLFGRMLMGLARMIGGDSSAAAQSHGSADGLPARARPQRASALRDLLTRLAIASRASALIGARQSAYLRKLLKHFDEGDLMEALRHAIPLDGLGPSLGQSFGTPGRRDTLAFSGAATGSLRISMPDDLRTHLTRRYRAAFERLDREGRIEEAAFVLAELLNARQECLDYLERHGRAAQGAELALTWDMPSSIAIRLLLLAGDLRRATLLARRDNAFAQLVPKLEREDPLLAQKLRVLWGEALADRGEWLSAIDAVWPVPQARELALGWLRIAERGGDVLSARALVQRAALLPDTLTLHGERIAALSHPDTSAEVRTVVGKALLGIASSSDALAEIALRILPALAADRAERLNDFNQTQLAQLAKMANDAALRCDLPAWSLPPIERSERRWTLPTDSIHVAPAAGLHAIHDACALPKHRYLIALGESGVLIVDRNGRTLRRYSAPCHRLVIADNGLIALAVAGREAVVRVTRLDLTRHVETDLGAIALQDFAHTFDGIGWSIVADGRLLVLDTARALRDALWSVDGLPGPVFASRWLSDHALHLMRTAQAHVFELWCYRLPERRLIRRETFMADPEQPMLLMPPGELFQAAVLREETGDLVVDCGRVSPADGRLPSAGNDMRNPRNRMRLSCAADTTIVALDLRATEFGLCVSVSALDDHGEVGVFKQGSDICLQRVRWPADSAVCIREHADGLLLFDDRGRLLDLSPARTMPTAFSLL